MCFRPAVTGNAPVKCPKCGGEVSPFADECPHGGARATSAPGMPTMPSAPKPPTMPSMPSAPKPPTAG